MLIGTVKFVSFFILVQKEMAEKDFVKESKILHNKEYNNFSLYTNLWMQDPRYKQEFLDKATN